MKSHPRTGQEAHLLVEWEGKVFRGSEGAVPRGELIFCQNFQPPSKSLFTECGGDLI